MIEFLNECFYIKFVINKNVIIKNFKKDEKDFIRSREFDNVY